MKNIIVKIYPHSVIDVITNSSTEIFCRITSDEFLNEIQKSLSKILNRDVKIYPMYSYDEEGNEYADKECIEFAIEYGDNDNLTEDFVNLIEFYLNQTIGENNYKINRGEY